MSSRKASDSAMEVEDDSSDDQAASSSNRGSTSKGPQKKKELTLPEFRQKYEELVKEIKDLVMKDDGDDNINEQVEILKQNLTMGSKLMDHIGTDNAKLQCTLKHLKVCLELADKKCRSMGTVKPFNIHKYLDILYEKNVNEGDVYSERKFLRSLTSEMNQYSNNVSSIISLLGVIDLHSVTPETPAAKTRSVNRNKYALDEVERTQHEIVRPEDTVQKEDTATAAVEMSKKLRKLCSNQPEGMSLYDFGLQHEKNEALNTHKFVCNIFNAACMGRDGYARISAKGSEPMTNGILRYSNWKIKDAVPPKEHSGSSDSKNVRRNQYIVSFNAKTFRAAMARKDGSVVESSSKRKAPSDLKQKNKKAAKISQSNQRVADD